MERRPARRLLAAGLALGLLAELILDGPAYGLNVPVFVGATLAAGWLVRRRDRAPDRLDAWLPLSAVGLAAFVAVRGDPFLAFVDTAAALAFTGGAIVAFSGVPVTRRSASIVAMMAALTVGATLAAAIEVVRVGRPGLDLPGGRFGTWVGPVARGLFMAVPLALIFVVLFASADPIFRRGVTDLVGWQLDLGSLAGRLLFVAATTWFATGLLSVAASGIPAAERSSLGAAARTEAILRPGGLGVAEALVVLLVVDLVIGAFVGLQLAYLFGGLDTLRAAGLTYSDYARRGFFELVAAACLAGGVVVALDLTIARRTRPYLAAVLGLIGLTGVVLVSAALRLRLYQDAYGWTELRLYVLATIVALGGGLALMIVLVVADRMRWLGHGLAAIGVVALVGLNLVAPAAFVAARNTERSIDPSLVAAGGRSALDSAYLSVLPDDAIPVLVAALPRLPEMDRRAVLRVVVARRARLAGDPSVEGLAAWNLGRERARAALDTLP